MLINGKIPSKLGDGALKVTQGLLAGILGPASVPLGLAVNALKALRIAYDLQNEHHFELLELDAEVDESGTTLLRVKPEAVSRIRLDKNKEGPRGLDHRHILVYRYRPTVAEGSRLGLVMNDGKASVALLQRPEDVSSIKVGERDEFVFKPSLTLSMIPLSEPLELIFDGYPVCEVEVDPLGRVHLTGLDELFAKSDSPSVRFEAGLGFGRVTSLPLTLHR